MILFSSIKCQSFNSVSFLKLEFYLEFLLKTEYFEIISQKLIFLKSNEIVHFCIFAIRVIKLYKNFTKEFDHHLNILSYLNEYIVFGNLTC